MHIEAALRELSYALFCLTSDEGKAVRTDTAREAIMRAENALRLARRDALTRLGG